jgi:predicted HD phosphohydrolase
MRWCAWATCCDALLGDLGDAGDLFGQTGAAASVPHSRLKHMFDAAESSRDMLFEGLSLHVFADRHRLQSYVVSGTYTLLSQGRNRT